LVFLPSDCSNFSFEMESYSLVRCLKYTVPRLTQTVLLMTHSTQNRL
jgi:hypothetical protein